MSDTDQQLLARYVSNRSDDAFAILVRRHLGLVYSSALRQVRSPQIAEEVSQSVFLDLARTAARLKPDTILAAWLYRVTHRTAVDQVRRESRRQAREKAATELSAMNQTLDDWIRIEPLLDEGMQELDEGDRTAILLRYFEGRSFREVGAVLGISDDAAQKRVSRAIDRLRGFFSKQGITVASVGLAGVISRQAVQAAPAGLDATISRAAAGMVPWGPIRSRLGALTALSSLLVRFQGMQIARIGVVVGVVAVLAWVSVRYIHRGEPAAAVTAGISAASESGPAGIQIRIDPPLASATNRDEEPDPLRLLMGVAEARRRIGSGSMQYSIEFVHLANAGRETNQTRYAVEFDGTRLRADQSVREFRYKYSPEKEEQEGIQKRADSMSRAAAVDAGLFEPFESRHVLVADGEVLMDYWETDGKPSGAVIKNTDAGTGEYLFDPRCLGLSSFVSVGNTVEGCLAYEGAKSIRLLGQEIVQWTPAWHVQIVTRHGDNLDFWMEVSRPERVLKYSDGGSLAESRYGAGGAENPLPIEVSTLLVQRGSPQFRHRFVREDTTVNGSVDPVTFTLAGLGMQIGTVVTDVRIARSIGFWTGRDLSEDLPGSRSPEDLPPGTASESTVTSSLPERLDLLEREPWSPEGLEAAIWIILNTPDGPTVEKASEVIRVEHVRSPGLALLCRELERMRPKSSTVLLEAILKDNPDRNVRGAACFALATMSKDEAKFGTIAPATAAAGRYFARVIADFGDVTRDGSKMADLARPELREMKTLYIGHPAPEAVGVDLDGNPMNLSDHRGRVVVLVFWSPGYIEAPDHRRLAERLTGKPFDLLGVYIANDLARGRADIERYRINWPSFNDKRDGPISTAWKVTGGASVWVLDRQGVIRHRGLRWGELDAAVDALLKE